MRDKVRKPPTMDLNKNLSTARFDSSFQVTGGLRNEGGELKLATNLVVEKPLAGLGRHRQTLSLPTPPCRMLAMPAWIVIML